MTNLPLRVVFWGTPELAKSVLVSLLQDARYQVIACVSQPDKPVGRDQKLTPPPVKVIAEQHGIPVYQPQKIRNNTEFFTQMHDLRADIFVVVAYGKILPKNILDLPHWGCLNIHGSLLPAWRGAAPIQFALMSGSTKTGVTLMKMDEGMDTGDMLATQEILVDEFETAQTLFAKFASVCGPFACESIIQYVSGQIVPTVQDHARSTATRMLSREDGMTDFSASAQEIFWKWKGLTPWPSLWTMLDGKKIIIERADYDRTNNQEHTKTEIGTFFLAGEVIAVRCARGILHICSLKPEGKKAQTPKDFWNGLRQEHKQFTC